MPDVISVLGKYIIRGNIRTLTGLRIGGSETGFDIGGVDNPVIRNPLNGQPFIPGSSLKGKMRATFEKLEKKTLNMEHTSGGKKIRRHECTDYSCSVCRVYGASENKKDNSEVSKNIPARLIVRDAFLTEESLKLLELMNTDTPYAEIKSENSLDRITAFSSPRSTERVPAGVEFGFEIIYTDVSYTNNGHGSEKVNGKSFSKEDMLGILSVLEYIEEDYIGGSGSRGYGKVEFIISEITYKPAEYYTESKDEVVVKIVDKPMKLSEAKAKLKGWLEGKKNGQ